MKGLIFISFLFVLLQTNIYGIIVSNPSDPHLFTDGIYTTGEKNFSMRGSYLYNNVYTSNFKDTLSVISLPFDVKYELMAGVLTFNFFTRLDLSGFAGTTNLEIFDDERISTGRKLAYGGGFKLLVWRARRLDISLDGKYFKSTLQPKFFLVSVADTGSEVFELATKFEEAIEEFQGSLAISYPTKFIIPYIGFTFLYSEVRPAPKVGILKMPEGGELVFFTNDSVIDNFWGFVIGASLINKKEQATLTVEARFFDQNAFSFLGQIRF